MADQMDDGGPAFPVGAEPYRDGKSDGMTLRQYYAGQALAGLGEPSPEVFARCYEQIEARFDGDTIARRVGQLCLAYADALIAEEKGGPAPTFKDLAHSLWARLMDVQKYLKDNPDAKVALRAIDALNKRARKEGLI